MLKDTLQEVLDEAHAGHFYRYDKDQYGKLEHWEIGLVGDCEDFALWCREQLEQKGIESDLVLCGVDNPKGDHLVLHVEGWILDNRYKWVQNKDDLPYYWISLGKPDGTWLSVTA